MRDKIWYEMIHIKFGEAYLAHYLFRQKSTRKWFKIITLVFSTGGVLGWPVWDGIPIIACALIAAIQLFNLIENQIIINDKDVGSISELRNKYILYFNKLEKLWIDLNADRCNEPQASEQFFELRNIGTDIEAIDNELQIRTTKILYDKADIETRNYFIQYHS